MMGNTGDNDVDIPQSIIPFDDLAVDTAYSDGTDGEPDKSEPEAGESEERSRSADASAASGTNKDSVECSPSADLPASQTAG